MERGARFLKFFEQIFLPIIADNEVTILFDECHALPQDLTMAFLTIFNTEASSRKTFEWNEMTFEFNFKNQTFIFATTETDKIFPPLKDRLTVVDFEPYSQDELAKIIELVAPEIDFTESCLQSVASTIRGNTRSAIKRAKEIQLYCGSKGNNFCIRRFQDSLRCYWDTSLWFNQYRNANIKCFKSLRFCYINRSFC